MNNIISSILAFQFAGVIVYLKVIFIIIALLFLTAITFLSLRSSWLKRRFLESLTEFFIYRPFGVKKTFKRWARITKRLEGRNEADYKLAIIEADGLLDEVLKKIGYKGETIKERLEQINPKTLPILEKLWQAHKVRNNVVHDSDYSLTLEEAREIVAVYEQAFRDLEVF